jgi:hypothetical protein
MVEFSTRADFNMDGTRRAVRGTGVGPEDLTPGV